LNPNNEQIVSASDIPITDGSLVGTEVEVPRLLEIEEIKDLVQKYCQAALNAIEAGFDGVEIHAANGYLIDQFIYTSRNKRTDMYGGSIENRARFALEIVDAIVDAIGPERTSIRFSPGTSYQDMLCDNVVETWSYITSQLQKSHPKLAFLHFIEARVELHNDPTANAKLVKDTVLPYRDIWKGSFITASGFYNAIDQAMDIAEETGNLFAFGRAFIANPDLVERLRYGCELNKYDCSTFYSHEPVGYTDYPFFNQSKKA
jgi:2,4-dienoyl-CoA reductase-like NADH-dependent reductase (Old Yellow Enzyme family)